MPLTATASASRQQLRDLLECAWPAVLQAAAEPLDSATWRAAVQVALDRTGATGELATLARVGYARFARQVTSALARWGAKRRCLRIVRAVWTAATSPQALQLGVRTQRLGALERASLTLDDWHHTLGQLADVEQRMTGVLDQLDLTSLVAGILGSARSAPPPSWPRPATRPVSIRLARWSSTPACAPGANQSGAYAGTTRISGRGRPALRLAAWRATWGALAHNPVPAARQAHLTTRTHNQLTTAQARTALAAIAAGQLDPRREVTTPAA